MGAWAEACWPLPMKNAAAKIADMIVVFMPA
jgi:hypothetical protein